MRNQMRTTAKPRLNVRASQVCKNIPHGFPMFDNKPFHSEKFTLLFQQLNPRPPAEI